MKTSVLIILVFLLNSCSRNSTGNDNLSQSDSLIINFNVPGTNDIQGTVESTDPKGIKKVAGFITDKTTTQSKCGYDGNIMFYKKDSLVADISFNYSAEGCHHFMQQAEGELRATTMSNEAAAFLKSLSEGKPWY